MDFSDRTKSTGQVLLEDLDPRRSPPRDLRDMFKRYSRAIVSPEELAEVSDSLDLREPEWILRKRVDENLMQSLFQEFQEQDPIQGITASDKAGNRTYIPSIYESTEIQGLTIIPSLLPTEIQWTLLSRLFLRDLSEPSHTTNLNLHYDIQYPPPGSSFFTRPLESIEFRPKDPLIHPPLNMERVLNKKLRWITLGGQYDWTNKVYPEESPPPFPDDISSLLKGIFPDMEPQAAIVNLYSPGDTLSLHRDVSEEVNRGLVSISLGCDGLFMVGLRDSNDPSDPRASRYHTVRLHSGDAIYMSGDSRYAWHAVPKILPHTCPIALENWPGDQFPLWRGRRYMSNKRINLNVRQMRNVAS